MRGSVGEVFAAPVIRGGAAWKPVLLERMECEANVSKLGIKPRKISSEVSVRKPPLELVTEACMVTSK